MSGETSVGVDPTPPVDPVPKPADGGRPNETPGLSTEEPEFGDEADIPPEGPSSESSSGPTERQPGSGPR